MFCSLQVAGLSRQKRISSYWKGWLTWLEEPWEPLELQSMQASAQMTCRLRSVSVFLCLSMLIIYTSRLPSKEKLAAMMLADGKGKCFLSMDLSAMSSFADASIQVHVRVQKLRNRLKWVSERMLCMYTMCALSCSYTSQDACK